ncbi:MAG: Stp1/IreP family PP2C-type Ser/Thr phosphatase [Clostridia bacterium]|nr:Stp1/IreP family PP2C-type Ser/Thr phosphatase [Clostridia bacterium]MBQ6172100.1 Stp1/IreP family PP2C-type Ser/Thr phosphatase [Clostridia bacterium]
MIIFGKTDVGKVRQTNQDAYAYTELGGGNFCAVVCDGMGGHVGGNVASETAIAAFQKQISLAQEASLQERDIAQLLELCIHRANEAVFSRSISEPSLRGMGTTIVTVMSYEGRSYIAHVGDSRAYYYNGEKIVRLTKDHSVVQEMIDHGELTEEEAEHHPYKHVITRVLGVDSDVSVEVAQIEIASPGKLLLCSDGLSNMLSDDELEEFLKRDADPAALCDELILCANERGGNDNITAVVVAL